MMIHSWKTLSLGGAVLFIAAGLAIAQPASVAVGKNGDIELTSAARVGTTTLEPGHYRLQHQVQDGAHFLVVKRRTQNRRGTTHYGTGSGKEIARVPCDVVVQDKKVRDTLLFLRREPDGTSVITQILIRGEHGGHLIALEPKTS